MKTPVNFETKKLLFNKGWRYKLSLDETGHRVEHSLAEQRWNEGDLTYVDITISEVVMWLYERHGIWIVPLPKQKDKGLFWGVFYSEINNKEFSKSLGSNYKSPTEAYEAAILYTLNHLI